VGLCELGVNPEALAEAVKDLRKEAARLRAEDGQEEEVTMAASSKRAPRMSSS